MIDKFFPGNKIERPSFFNDFKNEEIDKSELFEIIGGFENIENDFFLDNDHEI